MPTHLTNEQMLIDLQSAGQTFKEFPFLKEGATEAAKEIHKAMMNNWRIKLFMKWNAMQAMKQAPPLK